MKCREEHHRLKIEQFRLDIEENGRRYISYREGLRKTRNKGLNCKPRLISPKMYMNKTERCPLAFFLLFKSKRPVELRSMGPFYLTVIDAPLIDVLYKNQASHGGQHNKQNVEQNEKKVTIRRIERK